MPTIPYKYLKDENWESFYPMIGSSSFDEPVDVTNGGTGADTAAGARANLGAISATDAARVSSNVPFILDVAEGGTGANNGADAVANLGFESGTGYFKSPDGTLIQWGYVSVTTGATVSYVAPISTIYVSIQFRIPFISTEYIVSGSGKCGTGAATSIAQDFGSEALDGCGIRWWDAAARTFSAANPLDVKWFAIGRWK